MDSRWNSAKARPRRRRGAALFLGSALLALVTASCDTDIDLDMKPKMIERVGVVVLSQLGPEGQAFGQASFVALAAETEATALAHPFGTAVGTCVIGPQLAAASTSPASGPSTTRLSAGSIDLSVSGASFGTMTGSADGTYQLLGAAGPLPSEGLSLSLSASGSFPAFQNLSIDPSSAPTLAGTFDPTDVRLDSQFAWQPGEAGGAVVLIGHGDGVGFSCLADDALGAFAFPEEARDLLSEAGFISGSLNTVGRFKTVQAVNGDAQLLLGTVQLANVGDGR